MTRKTTLRPPPLTLLDKYHGKEIETLYSTTVTVTGGEMKPNFFDWCRNGNIVSPFAYLPPRAVRT